MTPLTYSRATSLSAALDRLVANEDARLLAGGMTLLPTMKQGLASASEVVDLGGIPFLRDIELNEFDSGLVIGAMATHTSVHASPLVANIVPGLGRLAGMIGDPQVRNRGTIGGTIANNDPAADYPAGLVGLAATIVTDRREIAADAFFTGMFETALEPDEIVVAVYVQPCARSAYAKFRHPISGYAMAGVFIADHGPGMGIRVAVTGAAPAVFRHSALEEALASAFDPELAMTTQLNADGMISDVHASGAYRAQLVRVMAAEAIAQLAQ